MTGNPDTFRQGASALRNAADQVEEKRKELIAAANGKMPDAEIFRFGLSPQSFVSLSSSDTTHPESKTSANGLTLDVDTFTSSSHRSPVRAQANLPPKVSSSRRSKKASQVNNRPSRRPEAALQVLHPSTSSRAGWTWVTG